MANTLQKCVWIMGILCLLQPAIAANAPLSKQIEIKNSLIEDAQGRIEKFSAEIDSKEKEKKLIEMDIKRFSQDVKRLSLDVKPDEATRSALNTAQFEVKRAEFNLEKNTATLKQLYTNRDKMREQKRIYNLQLEQLQVAGKTAAPVIDAAAEKQAMEKARLAQMEKIKQQEAAEVEKQRKALQAKLGVKTEAPAAITPAAKIAVPVASAPKPTIDTVKQKQQAAEKERLRVAELEKQKQLAAEKERLRLIEIEKQKQIAADKERLNLAAQEKQKNEKEQAEKQRAALAAKEAEENMKQAQAIEEKTRLAQLEQERVLAEAKKQQAARQQDNNPGTQNSLNQSVSKNGVATQSLTPQQSTQIQFLKTSSTLPPVESALTLAMARSLDATSEQPALGNHPDLEVANPIGSSPKTVGAMKYLGNNQYMLELRVAKGNQVFTLGQHSFVKNIPEHYDGIRCLLLVDARNINKPVFQLVVAGH